MELAVSAIQQDIRSSLNEQAKKIQYREDRYQIWRTVRNTLVIVGEKFLSRHYIITVRDTHIYDTKEDLSLEFLQKEATKYINLNLLPAGMDSIADSTVRSCILVRC